MQSTHRVFFAIELSPKVKTQLMAYQENLKPYFSVPVAPENFHITLSFLGKIASRKVETIIDSLPQLITPEFNIEIVSPIYLAKAKILALAISHGTQQLNAVKVKLESNLKQLDHFDLEKRTYLPHISLFREVESSGEKLPSFSLNMNINSLSLFESVTNRSGVQYHVIGQWHFKEVKSVKQQLLGK